MFGKLFKPRAHYVFDYKPRYYNERKERLQKLENEQIEYHELDAESLELKLTKNNLKNDWVKNKKDAVDRSTTLRLAIIIAVLVGLAAYILEIHTLI